MSEKSGGSAFPVPYPRTDTGMTLRDYFAAKAMAALMPVYWEIDYKFGSAEELLKCQVESAYEYADAMLVQREKKMSKGE